MTDEFDDIYVKGKVGIGTRKTDEKLVVDGKVKATAFIGEGSEITGLNGEKITAGIINDARISEKIVRVNSFDSTTGHKHTGATGDGPQISHRNLGDILPANTDSNDPILTKHVSDALAKGWQDHINIKSGNPHGTTAKDVGALSVGGGTINGSLQVNGNIGVDGNVGIGTMNPGNLLEIKNNGDVTPAVIIDNGTGRYQLGTGIGAPNDGKFGIYDHKGKSNRFVIDERGNVGIGTLNPGNLLEIKNNGDVTPAVIIDNGTGVVAANDGKFCIYDHKTNGHRLVIDENGNVGIGTMNPSSKLTVAGSITTHGDVTIEGDVKIAGNLGTHGFSPNPMPGAWSGGIHTWDVEAEGTIWSGHGYQSEPRDLAENYPSDMDLETGDVVCLDEEKDGIGISEKSNDPLVLGVISIEPGFLLNSKRDVKETKMFPVALCGRVPCKVVDENGPIKRGDLLTSSSTPGHAMKANPVKGEKLFQLGTIIGKAISTLKSGKGVIDIFVFSS